MTRQPTTELEHYQRMQWVAVGASVIALLAVLAVVIGAIVESNARASSRRESAIDARFAICRELNKLKTETRIDLIAQRVDQRAARKESRKFLRENPHGIQGVSPDVVKRGIRRLTGQIRRTTRRIADNANVDCPAFARDPARFRRVAR